MADKKMSTSVILYYVAWAFLILAILLAILLALCGCGSSCGSWASGKTLRDWVAFSFALAITLGLFAIFQGALDVEENLQESVMRQYFRA